MAVTLTIDDLKYPGGEMQDVMFPDGDIDDALTAWLSEATSLTTDNEAAEHYVYYRGYNAIANRIAATPSSVNSTTGGHSESWSDSRIKELRGLANHHKREFDQAADTSSKSLPRSYFGKVSVS